MPQYKVIAPGFYDGRLYDPQGKRKTLSIDLPFNKKNPMPTWLTKIPEESKALKEKREALEKSQKEADDQKALDDKNDIANASTEGDGSETSFISKGDKSSKVETL